jgi:cycloeucalenol cycloisomerase
MLATNPAKRAVERAWLLYTPVWGLACAAVMIGGLAEQWGDVALMAFGATLGLGAVALPIALRPAEERARPLHETTSVKLSASVVGFAFLYNWLQTPFFFDVLHMHYGFRSTWNHEHNPLFLYLLTIAYFATYSVLVMAAYRRTRRALARWPVAGRVAGALVAPFGVAFLETALNANPWMSALFCYDDTTLVLTFGSFAYGLAFVVALPVWLAIDETPGARIRLWHVLLLTVLAVGVDTALLHGLRHHVAPHLTTVVEGANGLRDFDDSCLEAPRTRDDEP